MQYHILRGSYLVILNNRPCFDIFLAVYVFLNWSHSVTDVAPFTVTQAHSCGQSRAMHPKVNLGLKLNVFAVQRKTHESNICSIEKCLFKASYQITTGIHLPYSAISLCNCIQASHQPNAKTRFLENMRGKKQQQNSWALRQQLRFLKQDGLHHKTLQKQGCRRQSSISHLTCTLKNDHSERREASSFISPLCLLFLFLVTDENPLTWN